MLDFKVDCALIFSCPKAECFFLTFSFGSCLCISGQRDLKQKTPVLKKQTQPQWKHLFVFNGVTTSQLRQSCLDLTLWDQSLFGLRDQFLGGARLGTSKLLETKALKQVYHVAIGLVLVDN